MTTEILFIMIQKNSIDQPSEFDRDLSEPFRLSVLGYIIALLDVYVIFALLYFAFIVQQEVGLVIFSALLVGIIILLFYHMIRGSQTALVTNIFASLFSMFFLFLLSFSRSQGIIYE